MNKGDGPTKLQKAMVLWPFMALVPICLLLLWGATRLEDNVLKSVKNRFTGDVTAYQEIIKEHIDGYSKVISNLESFLAQNPQVSQLDFNKEVTELARSENFRGISYAAFAKKIPVGSATEEIIKMRADGSTNERGYSSFKLYPTKRSGDYFSITHIMPYSSDLHGLDITSDPKIAGAVQAALDCDKLSATGKLRFYKDKDGFLLIAPIYQPGLELGTVEAREAALSGYVTLWFWEYDIFPEIENEPKVVSQLDYVVTELEPGQTEKTVLHSKGAGNSSSGTFYSSQLTLESERALKVADRIWQVKFTPSAEYLTSRDTNQPLVFYGLAWFTSLILGLMARRMYIRNKHRIIKYPTNYEEKAGL